jgi:hypothetical protein
LRPAHSRPACRREEDRKGSFEAAIGRVEE